MPEIFFGNKFYIRKTGVNYDPSPVNVNGTIVAQDFGFMVAFDYDVTESMFYMTDVSAHKIVSMRMTSAGTVTDRREIVKQRVYSVEGIAVDWVTK